jgi:hypothetical protein
MSYLEDILESFKNKSIAIIGNAVIKKPFGEQIDNHKIIIRINEFMLDKKYKEFTGEKFTHWCTHGQKYINRYRLSEALCPFYREPLKHDHKIITPKKEWRLKTGLDRLTTGGTFLFICAKLGLKINAFGFDFLKTGQYWDLEHKHSKAHNGTTEEEFIKTLNEITIHE